MECLVTDQAVTSVSSDRLADRLDERTATVVDVESRSDGEEISWLVSWGEDIVRVVMSASWIQEKTSATEKRRNKERELSNMHNTFQQDRIRTNADSNKILWQA